MKPGELVSPKFKSRLFSTPPNALGFFDADTGFDIDDDEVCVIITLRRVECHPLNHAAFIVSNHSKMGWCFTSWLVAQD